MIEFEYFYDKLDFRKNFLDGTCMYVQHDDKGIVQGLCCRSISEERHFCCRIADLFYFVGENGGRDTS